MNDDEPAPEAPYTITVTWTIGDALVVEYDHLQPWEARAALEEAVDVVSAVMDEEAEQ